MELVRIKAKTALTHGYRDESGSVVVVDLQVDEVGEVPANDARELRDKGLVYVAASDQEAIKALDNDESDEQPDAQTETDEQQANG